MATPIPQADAALLAAQAQAGQAGVAAYEAAKAALSGQREQAVQQALREASLRGTPLEAIQSLQSTITSPYDQQIAQLTQGQASFQGDMAARQQRGVDYDAAVGSARTLIPVQVQQQLAPILARNQFELGQMDRQSAARIAEIEAQRRLFEARAAAELEAFMVRQRQEAEEESRRRADLNQSELRGMLVEGARGQLGPVYDQASRSVRQTAEFDRQAAAYAGKGAAEHARGQQRGGGLLGSAVRAILGGGSGGRGTSLAQQEANRQAVAYTGQALREQQRNVQPASVTPIRFSPGSSAITGGRLVPASGRESVEAAQRAFDQVRRQQAQAVAASRRAATQRPLPRMSGADQARDMALDLAPGYRDPRGFITPDQLGQLGVYGDMLAGAGEPLTPMSIDRLVGGALDDQGQVSPVASDMFRQAMLDTAGSLFDQGYDLDDAQILEAIGSDDLYDPGSTLFDVESRAAGGRDMRTQFEQDRKAQEAAARDDEAAMREQEELFEDQDREDADLTDDALRSEFFRQWGIPLTESLGPRDDVVAITSSPEFDQAIGAFEQAADGRVPSSRADIDAILDDAGITDSLTRRLIREIYSG